MNAKKSNCGWPPGDRGPARRELASAVSEFVEFASFASTLNPQPKSVRFEGNHWKL